MISEQGYLGRFDDRHVFVALVIDDIDGDLADLLRPGAGSSKRTAEIAKRQARLSRKITIHADRNPVCRFIKPTVERTERSGAFAGRAAEVATARPPTFSRARGI